MDRLTDRRELVRRKKTIHKAKRASVPKGVHKFDLFDLFSKSSENQHH